MTAKIVNIDQWIAENKDCFLPPVCNKLMHGGQLKVMFVGGPNNREDFHLEEGEELFFQLKGDMSLPIMERGERRKIDIKQGEIFLLPGKIPHSPQRTANSMGAVFERSRLPAEMDALRYYVHCSNEILWERWFHCRDLGKDLGPIIKSYNESEAFKSQKPAPDSFSGEPAAFQPNTELVVQNPFALDEWFDRNSEDIKQNGTKIIFGPPSFKTIVTAFGIGEHQILIPAGADVFFWQMKNCSKIVGNSTTYDLNCQDSCLFTSDVDTNVKVTISDEYSRLISVCMVPPV